MTRKPKILIATAAFDGHFNPLTSLAKHLQGRGYDVRWYTGKAYEQKLNKLEIPFFPFIRAQELNQDNVDELLPERTTIKSPVGKIKFDIKHVFVGAAPKYFEDVREIHLKFPFDLMVIDPGFTAGQLVKEILDKPVITIGVTPVPENSKDCYPNGLGRTPRRDFIGRLHQGIMRFMADHVLFRESTVEYNRILTGYGLKPVRQNIFDLAVCIPDLYLQIGSPGFEYYRSDLSKNVRFIGSLLPYSTSAAKPFVHAEKLQKYKKVILVSQGTVDNKEPEKLMVPTMEAYKDTDFLVVVTTGGVKTDELRQRFPQENIIVEDFVDYGYLMPKADVFVTCGGYGSVMLSISHRLPMVAAGLNEGKNEINARLGYFKLGKDLKTDRPKPQQIREAVQEVMGNPVYRQHIEKLRTELMGYNTLELCEGYIRETLPAQVRELLEAAPQKKMLETEV